jgi:hypothetical protein
VNERLEIGDLLIDGDKIAVELYTEFECIQDYPEFSFKPLKRGDVVKMRNFIFYNLENEKFKKIRVARFQVQH